MRVGLWDILGKVDWYTCSLIAAVTPEQIINSTYGALSIKEGCSPLPNYESGYILECGAKLCISSDEVQGSRVDFSGKALDKCREQGLTPYGVINYFRCTRWKTTRIDVALDFYGGNFLPELVWGIQNKTVKCKVKKEPFLYKPVNDFRGWSVYVGAKTSYNRLRIYDKAAEQKQLAGLITRFELQARKPLAEKVMQEVMEYGAGITAYNRVNAKIELDGFAWWQSAGEHLKEIELGAVGRKETSFEWWLENQVKPAILNRYRDGEETALIEKWLGDLARGLTLGNRDGG